MERERARQWQSEFQQLRDSHLELESRNQQLVSLHQELKLDLEREQILVLQLNQELAKKKGSLKERAKALEWDLQ
jgi:ABC-type siderophore export system fused ATPase/permease subunit